jgi:hypothetical protein
MFDVIQEKIGVWQHSFNIFPGYKAAGVGSRVHSDFPALPEQLFDTVWLAKAFAA